MFDWLRPDPKKALRKKYEAKLREAHDAMNRKADRGLHAELMAEAEQLADELEALEAS